MDNPITDSIIDRIKKLLRLSTSSNINEASNAAAKAQELIDKYKLDMASIDVNETTPTEPIEDNSVGIPSGVHKIVRWNDYLLRHLCEANTCRHWINPFRDQFGRQVRAEFRLIGTKTNIEITRYMFAYLTTEIERLAQHELKFGAGQGFGRGEAKSWSNNFRLGAVQAIGDKLKESHKKVRNDYVGTNAFAIVLKADTDLANWYEDFSKRMGFVTGGSSRTRYNSNARAIGYKAGSNIHLGKALSPNSGRLLNK